MECDVSVRTIVLWCNRLICAVLFGAILLSPWARGCVNPDSESWLFRGLAVACFGFSVWLIVGTVPRFGAGWEGTLILGGLLSLALIAGTQLVSWPPRVAVSFAPGLQAWYATPLDTPVADGPLIRASSEWVAGNRLGLNASGSLQFLVRLLMVSCVFVVSSCLLAPRTTLTRLAHFAVAVGTALSIFAILDFLARPAVLVPGLSGGGFGPFVNRNHYPFFLNVAIGLTLGLIFDRVSKHGRSIRTALLNDAASGWLLVGLVFMLGSLVLCSSRGGVLSLLLASGLILFARAGGRWLYVSIGISGVSLLTFILLTCIGFDFQSSRLNPTEPDAYSARGRLHLWSVALKTVPEFPWFGSGAETFQHWERIDTLLDPAWNAEEKRSLRADNEYLDVLNEFGVLGLIAVAIIVGPLLWKLSRSVHDPLLCGASIGMFAVMIHSFVDFGLRVPANAVFATVTAALLCSAGRSVDRSITVGDVDRSASRIRFLRYGLAVGMAGFVLLR